jgi:hypothetical protein
MSSTARGEEKLCALVARMVEQANQIVNGLPSELLDHLRAP